MAIDLERFPTSESAKRMISYVSEEFYERAYVAKWLYQVMGLEWDEVWAVIEALPEQAFPETATWGLRYHELKWGLPVREGLDYEERRKRIYRKRDLRAPMTPWRLEWYLQNTTGYDFHIEDINDAHIYGWTPTHPNTFKVYAETGIDDGSLDAAAIRKRLNELKQSHTTYSLQERAHGIIDSSDLEQIEAFRAILRYRLPFWYQDLLDGAFLLDGSHLLRTDFRYELRPGLLLNFGRASPMYARLDGGYLLNGEALLDALCRIERVFMPRLRVKSEVLFAEELARRLTTGYRIRLPFWYQDIFDGREQLDGSELLNTFRRYELRPGMRLTMGRTAPIYARINGCHFLDGSARLDGLYQIERFLNQRTMYGSKAHVDERFAEEFAIRLAGYLPFWNLLPEAGTRAGLNVNGGGAASAETARFAAAQLRMSIAFAEELAKRSGISIKGWSAHFWPHALLDGASYLDGKGLIDAILYRVNPTVRIGADVPLLDDIAGRGSLGMGAAINFWQRKRLNGTVLLNGCELLDAADYDVNPSINLKSAFHFWQRRRLDGSEILNGFQDLDGRTLGIKATARIGGAAHFWQRERLDGSIALCGEGNLDATAWSINTTAKLKAEAQTTEAIKQATLRRKSRIITYMDGSLALEGSGLLNSIDKKEEI